MPTEGPEKRPADFTTAYETSFGCNSTPLIAWFVRKPQMTKSPTVSASEHHTQQQMTMNWACKGVRCKVSSNMNDISCELSLPASLLIAIAFSTAPSNGNS